MKVAVFADIHANLPALEGVLKEIRNLPKFCCGDLVGYYSFPNEVIEIARKENIVSVLGNHDNAVVTGDTHGFNPPADRAIEWTAERLTADNREFLKSLPQNYENAFYMIHGSPKSPLEEYIYEWHPDRAFLDFFNYTKRDIIALGHTHQPFVKRLNEKLIFNPGSVGQPRDSDPRASYAVLDTDKKEVEIRRVEYDIERTAEKVKEGKMPSHLAERLFAGV